MSFCVLNSLQISANIRGFWGSRKFLSCLSSIFPGTGCQRHNYLLSQMQWMEMCINNIIESCWPKLALVGDNVCLGMKVCCSMNYSHTVFSVGPICKLRPEMYIHFRCLHSASRSSILHISVRIQISWCKSGSESQQMKPSMFLSLFPSRFSSVGFSFISCLLPICLFHHLF